MCEQMTCMRYPEVIMWRQMTCMRYPEVIMCRHGMYALPRGYYV